MLLEVEGERLTAVTAGAEPPADAERLAGLTLPGFANAHSHAFQRALRGRTHAGTGSFWTWREQMYALAERLDPDTCLALSRAAFAEMALAGIEFAIPADEVIDTMGEIGRAMDVRYRETAGGGLAATPTGRRLARERLVQIKRAD